MAENDDLDVCFKELSLEPDTTFCHNYKKMNLETKEDLPHGTYNDEGSSSTIESMDDSDESIILIEVGSGSTAASRDPHLETDLERKGGPCDLPHGTYNDESSSSTIELMDDSDESIILIEVGSGSTAASRDPHLETDLERKGGPCYPPDITPAEDSSSSAVTIIDDSDESVILIQENSATTSRPHFEKIDPAVKGGSHDPSTVDSAVSGQVGNEKINLTAKKARRRRKKRSMTLKKCTNAVARKQKPAANKSSNITSVMHQQREIEAIDVAAHLKLLGDSLTALGQRLTENEHRLSQPGVTAVVMDSLLCAIAPLMGLASKVFNVPPESAQKAMDHTKYFMPGAIVKLDSEGSWAVLILTPIMKRIQSLPCASEVIFVDSTGSCESTNSALTIMFIATKAGAIPLVCFLHESQTTESYMKAFSMLKNHFPFCFFGERRIYELLKVF